MRIAGHAKSDSLNIFRQYIPTKGNVLASKFTNSVINQGTNMTWECTWVKTHTPPLMTWLQHTHTDVRHLTCRVEGLGYKILMDKFFSSPRLFDDMDRRKINSCAHYGPAEKICPVNVDQNNQNW